jgi:hypothetical protein
VRISAIKTTVVNLARSSHVSVASRHPMLLD